jgi:thiazole synthase ThiGH ThiG subunit
MTSTKHVTEAQQMARSLGVVVGAASCCELVTEERVNSIALKLRHLVATTANDTTDADAANKQFAAAVEAGKQAVDAGRIDPEHAESALTELENQLLV